MPRLAVLILLSLAPFAAVVTALVLRPDPFATRPFDPKAWASAKPEGRAAMVRDAIRRLPVGLTEGEVVALLGKPDEVIETRRLTRSGPPGAIRTYEYYLGCWSGVAYDDTSLWVHVNAEGRVLKAVIGGC